MYGWYKRSPWNVKGFSEYRNYKPMLAIISDEKTGEYLGQKKDNKTTTQHQDKKPTPKTVKFSPIYIVLKGSLKVMSNSVEILELRHGDSFGYSDFLRIIVSSDEVIGVVGSRVLRRYNRIR